MATKKEKAPVLGDIVIFHTAEYARPAVVTHVWSENVVNLYVFPDGSYDRMQSFNPLRTSIVRGEEAGHWSN